MRPPLARPIPVLVCLLTGSWLACTGGRPAPPATGKGTPGVDGGGAASTGVASASSAAPLPSGAVSAAVFSDDECKADADCVPEKTCHPDRCRLADKAGSLAPGTLCTNVCEPLALECGQNHCGCAWKGLKKLCAVLPGP